MRTRAVLLTLLAAAPVAAQQTPADSARVYELTQVDVIPRPRNSKEFAEALQQGYPPHLRQAGVSGLVRVAFVVGADGEPRDVRVILTPDPGLDAPSVQAVSLLRFTPAQVQGRPVAVRVEQPIIWRVGEGLSVAGGVGGGVARGVEVRDRGATTEPIDGVYEMADVDELPRPLNGPAFKRALTQNYPFGADHRPVGATVQVRFQVSEDGRVSVPEVTRSSDVRFNEVTVRIIRVLRFRSARVNGRPVKVWVEQPIVWTPPPRPAIPPARRP
ncbi:TonB family protein [Longimicrobium sp.]|uniref:TonB family protein n=1 Tax=Longimicrobium sp. TaxID=2029185 RepID=UPI003B3B49DC